jgi:hypothetical protein
MSMFSSALEDEEMVEDRESARKKANLQVRAEQKSKSKLMEKVGLCLSVRVCVLDSQHTHTY